MLNVAFDVESREFSGKWYTNLTAWKVDVENEGTQEKQMPTIEAYQPEMDIQPEKDDLPF